MDRPFLAPKYNDYNDNDDNENTANNNNVDDKNVDESAAFLDATM